MILTTASVNRLQKSTDDFFLPRLSFPTMAVCHGRPPKGAKRNMSGLKNQSRQPSLNKAADNSSDSDYSDSEAVDSAFHQQVMEIYGCLPEGFDGICSRMGCEEEEAAPFNFEPFSDRDRRLCLMYYIMWLCKINPFFANRLRS
jgi:hypothetical protein